MIVRQNLHQHSCHSCDSACAKLTDIVADMEKCGITDYGVSDHLHSRFNLCDIESCRNDIIGLGLQGRLHLGVEASVMCKWECDRIENGNYEFKGDDPVYGLRYSTLQDGLPEYCLGLTAEDKKRIGIEYVICGSHWPLIYTDDRELRFREILDQHLWMIRNPLIDIVAHPWSILVDAVNDHMRTRDAKDICFDAILEVPKEWFVQVGEEALKYNKCIELNMFDLMHPYYPESTRKRTWEVMAMWREMGNKFVVGDDSHRAHACPECFAAMGLIMGNYGFTEDDIRYFFN